jgi:hypothetical protein
MAFLAKSFWLENWDGFTIFSALISLFLIIYFLCELFNNFSGCNDSGMSEEDFYFRAFDVDELNREEDRPLNFIQHLLNFLIPFFLVVLSNGYFFGALMMMILHGCMWFFFQSKTSKRQKRLKIQDRL